MTGSEQLKEIVNKRDLKALEAFCLRRKYKEVLKCAEEAGIDLEYLEELLYEIS